MPMYDYRCASCGASFEAIVRSSSDSAAPCPECASADTERSVLSVFAVGAGGGKSAMTDLPPECRGCGDPGACGMRN